MHAQVGDRIVVQPFGCGRPARTGEVVDVRGRSGEPPYVVRWVDTGMLALYFPGRDAHVFRIRKVRGVRR